MVYLKSVENVITLGKLIGLLFLFCLPLPTILFLKTPKIIGMSSLTLRNGNHFSSYSFRLYARAAFAWTKKKRSLRNENLKQTELRILKNRGKKG